VKDPKSRDSDSTILKKKFPGGNLAMVGANAPTGLQSRPIRVILCDEVDRYKASAGQEGDPISKAVKRTTAFWNRVIIFVSTPLNKGTSRIEKEYLAGDQRQRWCPCPECGALQILVWAQVKWFNSDPLTAIYECVHCQAHWNDHQRVKAMREGKWIPQKEFNGNVSYQFNQLYSPFPPLSDGVRDFLESKGNPEQLKAWTNEFLGETWEETGERVEWSDTMSHRQAYDLAELPEEVTLLTAGVDVQDDRLEVEVVGWGDDHKSWSIDYHAIYGDLSTPEPWTTLRDYLGQSWAHPLLGDMGLRMTCMDSGGHYTQSAYKFSRSMPRVAPIKGVGGPGKPIVGRPSKNNLGGVQLFPLGVDTIKELVVSRLAIHDPEAAGYCTFPARYGDEYFRGLTAEELRTRFIKGFKKTEWYKIRPRNEPFDLRVYATAALEMLSVDLAAQRRALLRRINAQRAKEEEQTQPSAPQPKSRRDKPRAKSWVDGWKHD
jgi:phage terminase large subunit GpA-like protein